MSACKFFYYGQVRTFIAGKPDWKPEDLTIKQYFIAGALTGFLNSFLDSPVDLFKSKMQAQRGQVIKGGGDVYKNVFHCAYVIGKNYGAKGLFQGLGPTILRDIGGNSSYFGFYELARRTQTPEGKTVKDLGALQILFAGGCAGLGYWSTIYPIDVIKSSMQTDAANKNERQYKNMLDCAQKLYQ